MPIYEWKCPQCGYKFERLRKLGQHKAICPKCQAQAKLLISKVNPDFDRKIIEKK